MRKICDNWLHAESVTFWHFQADFLYPLVYFGPQPSQFPVCKKESINYRNPSLETCTRIISQCNSIFTDQSISRYFFLQNRHFAEHSHKSKRNNRLKSNNSWHPEPELHVVKLRVWINHHLNKVLFNSICFLLESSCNYNKIQVVSGYFTWRYNQFNIDPKLTIVQYVYHLTSPNPLPSLWA